MSQGKVMNRWYVVFGAVLIQLCLGAIYAWSVFTPKLTLALEKGGTYGFSATQAAWIFSIGLLIFSVVMVISGRIMTKTGPRKLASIGGIVLGIGYILGGLFGHSFFTQLVFIGIIGGAGIGMAYVVPIAVGVKWFPDKKGMVTGLAVAGFGFGATFWVKSAGSWFGLLDSLNFFGLGGVQSVFLLYGVIFLVAVVLGSIFMIDPPAGYVPEGWTPPQPVASGSTSNPGSTALGMTNFESVEMLKTPQFYMTWVTFLFSAIAGLMVISCIVLFGIDALQPGGMTAAAASAAAGTAMALYAIFNGIGRIVWGIVSDKIGRKTSIFLMCLLQGIIMLLFYKMGSTPLLLTVGACIIGFNFGGNFALFPAVTADYFGNATVGLNYGFIFLSYGIAGVVGPQIAGYFKDAAKGGGDPSVWITPFIIAGVACLLGAAITLISKPPRKA